MILLIFAAIGGGLVTASIMAPLGTLPALIAAPFGGSLCAALTALQIAHQRGAEWQEDVNLDEQTDAMVATLRGVATQAARWPEDSAKRNGCSDEPLDRAGDRAA
ncbi:hypothetical protein [Methylorubrum aminovorans]